MSIIDITKRCPNCGESLCFRGDDLACHSYVICPKCGFDTMREIKEGKEEITIKIESKR